MKVLLVQPPFSKKEIASLVKYAPMGLLALAAYIRQEGYETEIYDTNTEKFYDLAKTVEEIIKREPQVLGLTAMTANIENALEIARLVKIQRPKIKIVLGGIHATVMPKEVLEKEYIDFIVVGEGEFTLKELLDNLNRPENFCRIKGLGYKQDKSPFVNERRELIKDLNALPIPAYDLLDIRQYRSPYGVSAPFISIIRSRGCPFRCIFCGVQNMFGRAYRCQSPRRTMVEVDYLVDRFKIKEIGFKDSEFTLNTKNVTEFCDLLAERKYDLVWSCNARVDCSDPLLYQKMKRAGCHTIAFGAESGDQEILNILKKDIQIEQIRKAVQAAQSAGIRVSLNFIIGSPHETKETIEKTIRFSKALHPDYVLFSFATPFPGTKLREMAIKNNWLLNPDTSAVAYEELIMNATDLSVSELKQYMNKAYRSFYLRPAYFFKRLSHLHKGELITSVNGLRALIKKVF